MPTMDNFIYPDLPTPGRGEKYRRATYLSGPPLSLIVSLPRTARPAASAPIGREPAYLKNSGGRSLSAFFGMCWMLSLLISVT